MIVAAIGPEGLLDCGCSAPFCAEQCGCCSSLHRFSVRRVVAARVAAAVNESVDSGQWALPGLSRFAVGLVRS